MVKNIVVSFIFVISGTHTHSSPGGVGGTALVELASLGFSAQNFNITVQAVVAAIVSASSTLRLGSVKVLNLAVFVLV